MQEMRCPFLLSYSLPSHPLPCYWPFTKATLILLCGQADQFQFPPSNNISSPLSHIIFHHLTGLPRPIPACAPSEQLWRIISHLLLSPFDSQWCQTWSTGNFFRTERWCGEQGIDNVPWFISEPTQPPAHEVFCWKKSCVLLYTIMVRESTLPTHSSSVWQPNMDLLIWLEGLFSGSHLGKYHPLEGCKTSVLPGYHFATTLQGQEIPVTTFTV